MAKSNPTKILGGGLLLIGLFLGINPVTLLLAIPVILGGLYFLLRRRKRG